MALSARLDAILALVEPGGVLADIGTHHGLVPLEAAARGLVREAIGIDRPRPLDEAWPNFEAYGKPANVRLVAGNGLTPLVGQPVDQLVFAGMGARLIARLLRERPDVSAPRVITQSNTEHAQLEAWLRELGYEPVAHLPVDERGRRFETRSWLKAP